MPRKKNMERDNQEKPVPMREMGLRKYEEFNDYLEPLEKFCRVNGYVYDLTFTYDGNFLE